MFDEYVKELRTIYFNSSSNKYLKKYANKIIEKEETNTENYTKYELLLKNNNYKLNDLPLDENYFRTLEVIREINYLLEVIFKNKDKEKLYEYLGAFYLIRSNKIFNKEIPSKGKFLLVGEMLRIGAIVESIFDKNMEIVLELNPEKNPTNNYQIKELLIFLAKERGLVEHSFFYENLNLVYLNTLYESTKKIVKFLQREKEEKLNEKIKLICQTFKDYKLLVNSHRFNKNEFETLLYKKKSILIEAGEKEKYSIFFYNDKIKDCKNIITDEKKFEMATNYLKDKIKKESKKIELPLSKRKNKVRLIK